MGAYQFALDCVWEGYAIETANPVRLNVEFNTSAMCVAQPIHKLQSWRIDDVHISTSECLVHLPSTVLFYSDTITLFMDTNGQALITN